jgi:hypothetical protein
MTILVREVCARVCEFGSAWKANQIAEARRWQQQIVESLELTGRQVDDWAHGLTSDQDPFVSLARHVTAFDFSNPDDPKNDGVFNQIGTALREILSGLPTPTDQNEFSQALDQVWGLKLFP